MPLYDYYCETNDQTIEARHKLGQRPKTWGELKQLVDMAALLANTPELADTPDEAPVRRLMGAPMRLGLSRGQRGCGDACGCC